MQFKPFFQSKAIIGVFVSFLGFIAGKFHVNLADLLPQLGPDLIAYVSSLLQLAGLVMAIVGRWTAKGPLTLTPTSAANLTSIRMLMGLGACGAILALSGCATTSGGTTAVTTPTGTQSVSSKLVNVGYDAENFLQQFNTGLNAEVPPAETFLQQTHNSGDAQTLALYSSLASLASSAAEAALKAGLPPPQVQASVSAALAPANAAAAAANVQATTPIAPATTPTAQAAPTASAATAALPFHPAVASF